MLDKKTLEMVKGMSREERLAYFEENKKTLLNADDLDSINGGGNKDVVNPDSRGDDDGNGNYYTSMGWTCAGIVRC